MQERQNVLQHWLETIFENQNFSLFLLAQDASFRKYFRVMLQSKTGLTTFVIMDAPPTHESLDSFIQVDQILLSAGVKAPKIYAQDKQNGFLLLEDFGDRILFNELNVNTVDNLYPLAMETLKQIQTCKLEGHEIPTFDKSYMLTEMALFHDWFLTCYLQITLNSTEKNKLFQLFDKLAESIAQQPQTLIHRDYHSRNLMIINPQELTKNDEMQGEIERATGVYKPVYEDGERVFNAADRDLRKSCQLGVIDFQDAMIGPFTYDLVSLLKDCYVQWPKEKVLKWLKDYYQCQSNEHGYTLDEYIKAFDFCGLQRHLKVIGIFCRLLLRDGKDSYLSSLPRIFNYVGTTLKSYSELQPYHDLIMDKFSLFVDNPQVFQNETQQSDNLKDEGFPKVFQDATRRVEIERTECTDQYMSTRDETQQSCSLKDEGDKQ